jgi:secreted trypsin-like serine protease
LQNKNEKDTKEVSGAYFYFKDNYDTDDESANAYVSKFIVHPDWDPDDSHYTADIAIAVLKEPLSLTNEVRHVCLNTPSDPIQSFTGRNGSVYGWGLTEELKTVFELRHVEVPLVDQVTCSNKSNPILNRIMSDTSFCAGARDGKTGACNGNLFNFPDLFQENIKIIFSGDSGGGMVLKIDGLQKLIGIISASAGQSAIINGENELICDLHNYLVYTDVSKFYHWINQVVLETI